ncbi:MFS transporter [Aestuariibaculum lutulentum]|uniref:MFS transporter n=1 Tax=Aestuariibaculum lutulentum TaxID=2920935 RepID=A0ABS9RLT6_9FLAO|nr:MFS transporter [Aestuariibaculum lutulentum]MCH4553903.1 MFS transporter [Aestuariibaculum lutulentum]
MKNLGIKVALFINYFVFAILLNSVGIVIKQAIDNYEVLETRASALEAFKDLPIAIVSFLVASFLPKIGYKKSMLFALLLVFFGCFYMYYGNSFASTKVLFLTIGIAFALIKVSVYSMIGLLTKSTKEHSSFMSIIEGFFMIGIASAYFIFPAFFDNKNPNAWLNVYLFLAGLIALSFFILLFSKINVKPEISNKTITQDFMGMIKLIISPLVIFFVLSAFLFVMVEQGIMTWLPTFNKKVLSLSDSLSVQMASILAISLAVGRLLAGMIVKRISWLVITTICIIISMIIVVAILPNIFELKTTEITSVTKITFTGFIFPIIGLFIAPIYPLINSVVLSALPKQLHSAMTGLIVIFSALGGTFGSRIIGYLFEHIGGHKAFYFMLIPMTILIISLIMLNKTIRKHEVIC